MKKRILLSNCLLVLALLTMPLVSTASPVPGPTPALEAGRTEPVRKEPGQEVLDISSQAQSEGAEEPKPDAPGETVLPEVPAAWTNIVTEGFEGGFPGSIWTLYYNGDSSQEGYGYTWDEDPYRAYSGSYSGWCADGSYESNPDIGGPGPYPNDMRAWMVYGPFDLSDACDAELLFHHWTNTELDYDYLFVGASLDGASFSGTTWSGDWTSSCGGWCYENFDLTDVYSLGDVTGQSAVWIGFKFHSDSSATDEGTYLDDITLRKETVCGEPDLEATDIAWSPSAPDECDSIELTGTVTNLGDADTGSFQNTIYLQGVPQCTWSVSNLSPGQQSQHSCSVGSLANGDYVVSVEADSNGDVAESNEGNNNRNEIMTVAVCGTPDIEATDIAWSPSAPDECDSIELTGTVTNLGDADTGSFQNTIYLQGVPQCTWSVSNLSPGQQSQHSCSVGSLANGDYVVSVEADSNGDVAESNEGNNNRNEIMTVAVCGTPDIDVTPGSLEYTCPQQTASALQFGSYAATPLLLGESLSMKNPAAAYCSYLCYDYQTAESREGGQRGMCTMPDGMVCGAWDFFAGKCGRDYSICAQLGLETVTLTDGRNPFSPQYAVCADSEGNLLDPVSDMIHLSGEPLDSSIGVPQDQFKRLTFAEPPVGSLPAAYDWRNESGSDWMTPVKDQGICGSCWAFSAVGVTEAVVNIASNNPGLDLDLSEQYLVANCSSAGACDGGSNDVALEHIRDQGIPDEACFPYLDGGPSGCSYTSLGVCDSDLCTFSSGGECSDFRCTDRCSDWASRLQRIDSTTYLGYNPSRDTIKQALIDHGPLAVSMNTATGSFDPTTDIYSCSDNVNIGHAVVIAGYDDSPGYWVVKNSWDDSWGPDNDGYFKVAYDNCAIQKYPYYADASPLSGLTISNVGDADLVVQDIYKVSGSCWLSINPQDGLPITLAPGQSTQVDVSYDCSCVGEGDHTDTIRIQSTDPDENPFDVPVTLHKPASLYPDLVVSQPIPSASSPFYVGQSVDWSVTTTNQGNAVAQASDVGYYLGTSCSDLSNRVNSDAVGALPPGGFEEDQDAYVFEVGDVGSRYMIAFADYQNDEPNESDENNNTSCYGPFEVLQQCHTLTRNFTGPGSAPTASPPNSTGCPADQYVEGESITMTSHPSAPECTVSWEGTDSSTSNHLTMPASDHTVVAHYSCPCVATVRVGSGSVAPGQTVVIPVDALNVPEPGLGAITIEIQYDSLVVEAVGCNTDPGGLFDFALCSLDTGLLTFTAISGAGVSGDFVLMEIPFQALGLDGQSSVLDASISTFTDPSGIPIPVCVEDGEILIEECYSLSTSVDPLGSGSVSADPSPNCGSDRYMAGAQVQLTADPASAYNFGSWGGDASGSCGSNPTTVSMDGHKSVTANFVTSGDVSCDSQTNSVDALFILQREVGLRPNDSYVCPSPSDGLYYCGCDVNRDGSCNSVDALFILQCEVGIPNLLCPASASAESTQSSRPAKAVKLSVDSAVSSPGESVSVPILAALGSQGMGAATIELAFDPEILKVTACTSDPEVALDFGVCHVEPQSGLVRLAGIASGGVSGNPVLAEISFEVVGESRGHSNLELTAYTFTDTAGQTIEVKVRNGRIRVVPARPARRPSR